MGFRLVPKSVTLNDLEQHNNHVVCIISPEVVEGTPIHFSHNQPNLETV